MLPENELMYEIWLNNVFNNDPCKISECIDNFGTARNFYDSGRFDAKLIKELKFERFLKLNKTLDESKTIMERCFNENIEIITIDEVRYPKRLKTIFFPPRILYTKGKFIDIDSMLAITVIGTREPSRYGEGIAKQISYDLASCGALIVSGLAIGTDARAHVGALDANMPTVAIMPCGVDEAYPKQNSDIYDFIQNTGLVISELPPRTKVTPYVFEYRNRIMAGLSMGTLVIEAKSKSGTRYTVRHAIENNRDVFALLGNVTSVNSEYPNELICEGAQPVRTVEDIISNYINVYPNLLAENLINHKKVYPIELFYNNIVHVENKTNKTKYRDNNSKVLHKSKTETKNKSGISIIERRKIFDKLSDTEKIIVKYLMECDKVHIDTISTDCKINTPVLNGSMIVLEMQGIIEKSTGNTYALSKSWTGE